MEQAFENTRTATGCRGGELFDGHVITVEAWGEERAKNKNSGMLAMAYLWRRFGPPWWGGDDYKDLVSYVLTTEDPEIFLTMHLSGSGLAYSVGLLGTKVISDAAARPMDEWIAQYRKWWLSIHPEFAGEEHQEKCRHVYNEELYDEAVQKRAHEAVGRCPQCKDHRRWREDTGVVHRVNRAIFDALKELERPVYVRDCAINIFGRCDDSDEAAERSKYAGYGVPKDAMDKYFAEEDA